MIFFNVCNIQNKIWNLEIKTIWNFYLLFMIFFYYYIYRLYSVIRKKIIRYNLGRWLLHIKQFSLIYLYIKYIKDDHKRCIRSVYKSFSFNSRLFSVNEKGGKECLFHKSSYASLKVSSKTKAMLLNHRQFIGIKLLNILSRRQCRKNMNKSKQNSN